MTSSVTHFENAYGSSDVNCFTTIRRRCPSILQKRNEERKEDEEEDLDATPQSWDEENDILARAKVVLVHLSEVSL